MSAKAPSASPDTQTPSDVDSKDVAQAVTDQNKSGSSTLPKEEIENNAGKAAEMLEKAEGGENLPDKA